MRHLTLVLVFLLGLILKTSYAFGNETDSDADYEPNSEVAHYMSPPVTASPVITQPIPMSSQPMPSASAAAAASATASSHTNHHEWVQVQPQSQTVAPVQSIQNNNNINLAPGSANVNTMGPNGPVHGHASGPRVGTEVALVSAEAEAATVLGARHHNFDPYYRVSLIPMVGGSVYSGQWGNHIGNAYTFGLITDVPLTPYLNLEILGSYGQYNISYAFYGHNFQQYEIGGDLKVYLTRGLFRPYLGGGVSGIHFANMTTGPLTRIPYNQWVGFGQIMGGADIEVSEGIAIGGRAQWYLPMFNRPYTVDNGFLSAPGFEEAAAINTSFYRFMATLKVAL